MVWLNHASTSFWINAFKIVYSEIEETIPSLKKNKSLGLVGITAELLQVAEEQLPEEICKICNKAWQEGIIPKEWVQIHPNNNT